MEGEGCVESIPLILYTALYWKLTMYNATHVGPTILRPNVTQRVPKKGRALLISSNWMYHAGACGYLHRLIFYSSLLYVYTESPIRFHVVNPQHAPSEGRSTKYRFTQFKHPEQNAWIFLKFADEISWSAVYTHWDQRGKHQVKSDQHPWAQQTMHITAAGLGK